MRIIKLPEDRELAQDCYSIYYTAAFAGKGPEDVKSVRTLVKLQDALEPLSHKEEDENGNPEYVLNDDVDEFSLEDQYWELLKSRIFNAGLQWSASFSRKVLTAYEALEDAEEEVSSKKDTGL